MSLADNGEPKWQLINLQENNLGFHIGSAAFPFNSKEIVILGCNKLAVYIVNIKTKERRFVGKS